MKFTTVLLALLFSFTFITSSQGGFYDDWSDDSICSWLKQKPNHEGYQTEAQSRSICGFLSPVQTQIEWVDGLYAKSIADEFKVLSKDFSKPGDSGDSMIIPLGFGDFSGDGVPEIVYGISYWDLKRGSQIKPIFITNTPGEGLSLFSPIMDVVPYVGETRDFIIEDLNGDGINDIFIADHGPDYDPFPGAQNLLILSAPNGKFINATLNLPQISDFSHGVTSGDIDSDGDIDLFVTQNGANFNIPHYFLINDGKGKFTKVPDGKLLDKSLSFLSKTSDHKRRNFYFDAGLEFVDDDDKLDLILLSGKLQGAENNRIVFGSNSGFKLKNAVELQPGRFNSRSMGVNYLLTDIDNDGDNDILILHATSSGHQWGGTDLQVLVQEENRKFIDKSDFYFPGVVFDYGTWGMYLNLIDLNNDDKKDIVITAFHGIDDPFKQGDKKGIPKVFIRQDDGSFRPLNNDLLTDGQKFTFAGIRPVDIDNDGDIEFVTHKSSDSGFTVQVVELTTDKSEFMYSTTNSTGSKYIQDEENQQDPQYRGDLTQNTDFDFSRYHLATNHKKVTCTFLIKEDMDNLGKPSDWNLAEGKMFIEDGKIEIYGRWNTGGLSTDPKYLKNEVNLRLTADGHLVGKMAFFEYTQDEGNPKDPQYLEIRKSSQSTPLNYKSPADGVFDFWLNVSNHRRGVIRLNSCY